MCRGVILVHGHALNDARVSNNLCTDVCASYDIHTDDRASNDTRTDAICTTTQLFTFVHP